MLIDKFKKEELRIPHTFQSLKEFVHPVWGKIFLKPEFAKVLEIQEFRELSEKTQLGIDKCSTIYLNSLHTRLSHSIGVMHLTEMLFDVCKEKFSKYFHMGKKEKEVLMLLALGHDIGHSAFSHSVEDKKREKSHEQKSIEIFEKRAKEINEIFGYDITTKVLKIFKSNIELKKHGMTTEESEEIDIIDVFSSFIIGAIDCDRVEYVTSDTFMLTGERLDFTSIFNYVTIIMINGRPTVCFEMPAVPIIEKLLITRFNLYRYVYNEINKVTAEMKLKEFIKIQYDHIGNFAEYEIMSNMRGILKTEQGFGNKRHRISDVIINGTRENLYIKKFENLEERNYFLELLRSIVPEDIYRLCDKKICIYNSTKNKIYIRDENGIVKDITEASPIIQELSLNIFFVMVDLDSSYVNITKKEANMINNLFKDNKVEIEKKFITSDESYCSEETFLERLKKEILLIPNMEIIKMEEVINEDVYYELLVKLPLNVALRCRKIGSEKNFYVKILAEDGTNVTKREEHKFYNFNKFEQFLEAIKNLLALRGVSCTDKFEVKEGVRIKTKRYKLLASVVNSIVEIACDFSEYSHGSRKELDFMLECELKEGEDLSLWYLSKYIKQLNFVETNETKEKRAKNKLGLSK